MNWLPADVEMTHATRTDYLASVMLDGIKTSSDGRVWCRKMDCANDASHYRGSTPLDAFSSCIITLKAAAENLEIDAEDIGGDGERVVTDSACGMGMRDGQRIREGEDDGRVGRQE